MSTFLGQLVGFAVIAWLVWRYVVPPVRRLMTAQQETVRKQLDDSAAAKKRLAEAQSAHQNAIEQAASDVAGGKSIRMPSGAGHDAQVLATIMPAGMLFVPSIDGISHHWNENTDDADIVRGAEVFVETCRRLLSS